MCSNGAPATPTLARVLGTYWDEFSRELGRIPWGIEGINRATFLKFLSSLVTAEVGQPPTDDPVDSELKNPKNPKGAIFTPFI